MSLISLRRILLLFQGTVVAFSVASCAGRIPLPKHLEVQNTEALLARMAAKRSTVKSFVAEARMTYFGPSGRVKGTATIAVARPASLRYEIQGPHGGTLEAFACDGERLQLLNLGESRFIVGEASPENLDRLMSFAPLGFTTKQWVSVLFGDFAIPKSASHRYDDRRGVFVIRWLRSRSDKSPPQVPAEGQEWMELSVDPKTSMAVHAAMIVDGEVFSEVEVESRDTHGLPAALHVAVPKAKVEMRMKLRDLTLNPELAPAVFQLQPPAGVVPEFL